MTLQLYLDEDSMDRRLVRALRGMKVDVMTAGEARLIERSDSAHLEFASANNRVLYSSNIADFCRLHSQYSASGKAHAGLKQIAVGGLSLPFEQYVFSKRGQVLHVFYCRWDDRAVGNQQTSLAGGTGDTARFHRDLMKAGMIERAVAFAKMRLGSVLAGQRHRGQQVLEVAIAGPASPEEALEVLRKGLAEMVRHEPSQ